MATRNDPFLGHSFQLKVGSDSWGGFSQVTIPEQSIEVVPYREGTDGPTRKLSGMSSVGTVTLKRGITYSMDLYNWFDDVASLGALGNRKSLSILLMDDANPTEAIAQWDCVNAWPSKLDTGGLDASTSSVVIETLEIQCEGVSRKTISSS